MLRTPGAARFSVAGIIGRTPMAMFGLGTVLLIASSTGQLRRWPGLVAGAGSIGYAASAPQLARLADRFGQHRVLRPLVCVFAVACGLFVACAELHAPFWALLLAGCLAGSSMPSLGSMVRARWSALLTDPASLHAAFALESVADEMIFVIGPGGGHAARDDGPAGRRAAVHGHLCHRHAAVRRPAADRAAAPNRPGPGGRRGQRGARLPGAGPGHVAPVYLCLGAMFASIDLSTIDFAQRHGHKPLPASSSALTRWAAASADCGTAPGPGRPRSSAGSH